MPRAFCSPSASARGCSRHVVAPEELRVRDAKTARVLARAPFGATAAERYDAPYWVIHRGDLQTVLLESVRAHPAIALTLGTRVDDFAQDGNGVTISARAARRSEERGVALIAADGLWSSLRGRLGDRTAPRFARHTAWRALAPADAVTADQRAPAIDLWLGQNAHLVHYPVRSGALINIVAIIRDDWREPGWSAPGNRADILARYPGEHGHRRRAPCWPRRSSGANGRSTTARRLRAGARGR